MATRLHSFPGGMRLEDHKSESVAREIRISSLPSQLFLPLKQHIGDYPQPQVAPGDRVLKGQVIASVSSSFCAAIHAPTSGTVIDIGNYPVAHPSGQSDLCIVIDVDGKKESIDPIEMNLLSASPQQMLDRITAAGIVGLGGAAFPTFTKLTRGKSQGVATLIINGVECEPYISCDDMLMRRDAEEVIRGVDYLQRILSPRNTLIGIEDNKPEAIQAMTKALQKTHLDNTEIVSIPTKYPSGGEKQLIQILTGREVPQGKLAFDIGMLCQNVGTCAAISRALEHNQALTSRVVTLSGNNIVQSGNWEVAFGTPVEHLIQQAGGYQSNHQAHWVMGGPMMGFSLSSPRVPVVKASNCILVMRQETIPKQPGYHDECIRCGKCTEVCPAGLLPQQLYWHARARSYDRIQAMDLFDCIECGCCSAVCPSNIPLVQYYRASKSDIRAAQKALVKSDRARIRFEFREKRLLLKKQQDEERRRLKREALKRKKEGAVIDKDAVDPVQAALERVKARKKAMQDDAS
ncbi:MAG: electron transport complex subunit RsxC [Pseudomonadota bacterium]